MYAASDKASIYKWASKYNGNTLVCTYDYHDSNKGPVTAMMYHNGYLFTAGCDKSIKIIDTGRDEAIKAHLVEQVPISIDMKDDVLLLGLSNGKIIEFNENDFMRNMPTYVRSHTGGNVCGLELDAQAVWTAGDDNSIVRWDPYGKVQIEDIVISKQPDGIKKEEHNSTA